jgi:hypothetical protein
VAVDGAVLSANQFTFDPVHGWVTVGPEAGDDVVIRYVYSRKLDMAITNWDAVGNYLYYNLNNARAFGDYDRSGQVDLDDYDWYLDCVSGPGAPADPECLDAFDADEDLDIDFDDFAELQSAVAGGP